MATHGAVALPFRPSDTTAVLSIGRLGVASGADYYLANVANSVDDYYLGRGEAPGRWIGSASADLGLTGEVDPTALRNLLGGRGAKGEDLGIMRRTDRRPGFDLTFSAPKGLSLLWAFGPSEVRDAVSSAHDRAIGEVIDHLSLEAAYSRRGTAGRQLIKARGFVAAGFRHRTSRAGDPQLHTHVLVPNVVRGEDGRWSAPDARQLYFWQKAATAMYQSAVRSELAVLGVSWTIGRNGLGELSGIPKPILRAFSRRRADIEAALDGKGFASQRAAEVAALATRSPKPGGLRTTDALRAAWAAQLDALTLTDSSGEQKPATPADITAVVGARQPTVMSDAEREEILCTLVGARPVDLADYDLADPAATRVAPLTLFASTFTRRDALAAVARSFDARPSEVAQLTRMLLRREDVFWMIDSHGNQPDLSGRGRERPASTLGDRRYTTEEMLRVEGRIVNSAKRRLGPWNFRRIEGSTIEQVIETHPRLDREQAAAVRKLLGSRNGLDVVIGQAGTGKSTMLAAARAGWEAARCKVIGTAVASRTAAELEAGTGIECVTMARLCLDLDRGTTTFTSRHVIVVDEASLVGSRGLDRLQRHVDRADAKLVLVGDNRQLSSIDAGGALRALSNSLSGHVIELTRNRRQVEADQEWERQALVALRKGQIARAIAAYDDHDRIAVADDVAAARQALIERWWSVHAQSSTAILAVTRSDVAALNELARSRRAEAGELGAEIRLSSGKTYAVGDRILLEKNGWAAVARDQPGAEAGPGSTVAVRNGTFATVVGVPGPRAHNPPARAGDYRSCQGDVPSGRGDIGIDEPPPERRQHPHAGLVVELVSGHHVTLSSQYAEQHTSLGYALTVFRSQGITVDHAFLLANDTLFQEAGYTALSRGRLSNHLYAVAPDHLHDDIAHGDEITAHRDALACLVDALGHSHEQTMALESISGHSPADGKQMTPESRLEGTVEEWFQRFGRDLAWGEERTNAPLPAAPQHELDRFHDRDYGHDRDYDSGFGM